MHRTAALLVLLLGGAAPAFAQATIPANQLPGRERERFIESPLERFMRPGPFAQPPVVDEPKSRRKSSKRGKRPRNPR
jgi:hypothetical protein